MAFPLLSPLNKRVTGPAMPGGACGPRSALIRRPVRHVLPPAGELSRSCQRLCLRMLLIPGRAVRRIAGQAGRSPIGRGDTSSRALPTQPRASKREISGRGRLWQSHMQPQVVTGGILEILFDAEVPLGRLNRSVPERKLDLLERCIAEVGQVRICPA